MLSRVILAGNTFFIDRIGGLSLSLVLLIAYLLVESSSGLKNAIVWLGVIFFAHGHARHARPTKWFGLGAPALAYVMACGLSAACSIDPAFSFSQWIKLLELAAGYYLVANLVHAPGRVRTALYVLAWGVGCVAIADLVNFMYLMQTSQASLDAGRWHQSLLGFPTIASSAYGCGLLLLLGVLFIPSGSLALRLTSALMIGATGYMLYLLQTRSVYLGVALGCGLWLVMSPLARRFKMVILILVVLILAVPVILPGAFRDRLFKGGVSDRQNIWSDAALIIEQRVHEEPWRVITGVGYGHQIFEELHKALPRKERDAQRVYDHTHNLYIELFLQSGLLGCFTMIWLFGASLVKVVRYQHIEKSINKVEVASFSASLAVLLVYGQVSLFLASLPALMFWSILGLLASAIQVDDTRGVVSQTRRWNDKDQSL